MSSITTLNGSDKISSSRSVINANFAALNADKLEGSAWIQTPGAVAYVASPGALTSDPAKLHFDPDTSVLSIGGAAALTTGSSIAWAQLTGVPSLVLTTNSYADPAWLTALSWGKITGAPATGVSSVYGRTGAVIAATGDYTAAQVTNAVSTLGSYADPAWITSLSGSKISGAVATANALATARNIAGVAFNGTADISLASTNLSDSSGLVRGAAALATAGAVPYVSSAGSLTQNAADLSWDNTNKWIKIAGGTAAETAILGKAAGGASAALFLGQGTPNGSNYSLLSAGTSTYVNSANGAIIFSFAGVDKGRFAATSGNFLIGNNTDSATAGKLQVTSAGGAWNSRFTNGSVETRIYLDATLWAGLINTGAHSLRLYVDSDSTKGLQISGSTGNISIGSTTDGNFKVDVTSSGTAGTIRAYDQTPITGVTQAVIRAGAGQGGANLLTIQNASGSELFAVLASGIVSAGTGFYSGASGFVVSSRSRLSSPVDGQWLMQNGASTDFSRLMFGGTTSSFPALKRNATALEAVLADDSGYATFRAIAYSATSGIYYMATGQGAFRSHSDGVFSLNNNAGDGFNRLQFGGTTSAFPSLKRSSTALHVRLADDSGYGSLVAGSVGIGNGNPSAGLEVGSTTAGLTAKITATLSAEMAPALAAPSWTLGAGWSITDGKLVKVAGSPASASPASAIPVVAGRTYRVVIVVDASSLGSNYLSYSIGGVSGSMLNPGTITDYIVARTTGNLTFAEVAGTATITISSVSVVELTSGTGDLVVDGSLAPRGVTRFFNAAAFGVGAPDTAPVNIMEMGGEALRIYRSHVPAQYMSLSEGGGTAHVISGYGEKPFQLRTTATGYGFEFFVKGTANSNRLMTLTQEGGLLLGNSNTDSGWVLDVTRSGSSGTVRVYDQTAVTGNTLVDLRAGAGQTTYMMLVKNSAGTTLGGIDSGGNFLAPILVNYGLNAGITNNGVQIGSDKVLRFSSTTGYGGAPDVALSRISPGVIGVGTGTAGSTGGILQASGYIAGIATKSASYTVLNSDFTLRADTTAGSVVFTLPSSPVVGQIHVFKKATSGNTMSVASSALVDGAAQFDVTAQYGAIMVQFNGTSWDLIGRKV